MSILFDGFPFFIYILTEQDTEFELQNIFSINSLQIDRISAPSKEHLEPIPNGSSKYWELGNPKNQYVCIGGMGPIYLPEIVNVSKLIDFNNKVSHISFSFI